MQERGHRCIIESNAEGKRSRNGPKRHVLTDKIGAIFFSACGSRRRGRTPKTTFYIGGEEKECTERPSFEEHGLALNNKTHPCQQMQVAKVDAGIGCRRRRLTSTFTRIFRKSSTGFNLRKWKTIRIGSADGDGAKGPVLKFGLGPGFGRIVRRRDVQREEKTKKASEEGESEVELCKMRILMGEKCRPLNQSGVLHYDNDGILLPEDVVPFEES